MSKLRIIFLSFILTLAVACGTRDPHSRLLNQVDIYNSALHYFPDSALMLIQSLQTDNDFIVTDTVRYANLRNLTLAANSLPVPADTFTVVAAASHKMPTVSRSESYFALGLAQYHKGQILKALISLQSALSINDDNKDLLAINRPFLIGDIHSAIAGIYQTLNDSAKVNSHRRAAEAAYQQYGELLPNSVRRLAFILPALSDSVPGQSLINDASQIIIDNLEIIAPDPDNELSDFMFRYMAIVIIVGLCIILTFIVIYFYRRHRKLLMDNFRDYRAFRALSAMMDRQLEQGAKNKAEADKLKNYLTEILLILENYTAAFHVAISSPNEKKRALDTLLNRLRILLATPGAMESIENYVNISSGGILKSFRIEFPDFSEADYRIFMYYAARFSARSISILLNLPINQIYNKKSYLRRRIRNSSSPDSAIYLSYLD